MIEQPQLKRKLLRFCSEVALGLEYLTKKNFVHRDIAARNILLTDNCTCKVKPTHTHTHTHNFPPSHVLICFTQSFLHYTTYENIILPGEDCALCVSLQIADFGMSRDLVEQDYYHSSGGMVPFKWTSPEVTHTQSTTLLYLLLFCDHNTYCF